MGNSQTKEARGQQEPRASGSNSPTRRQDATATAPDTASRNGLSSRHRGSSRPDFSFLGIGGNNEQDTVSLEQRRENKVEREARKAEKERQARLKERERSMKEEHIDGGYLVTQGVYVGVEDFNKVIVRQLMIERRLAPFWRGLNDFSESWAEHQLMAAARGMSIPPPDEVPPELEYTLSRKPTVDPKDKSVKNLTLPITGRSQSYQSDHSGNLSPSNNSLPLPSPLSPTMSTSPSTPLFRARAKTLAALTTSSKNNSQADMTPREFQLPVDAFVNGQPIEVYLYKDASECPICFLYYPPYLNTTRCCEQPICSECFVQIKRPDPHPPEHEQPDPNAPPVSEEERLAQQEGLLVSEVATCPYCKQPEFGITYGPPPFRRGLTYGSGSQPYQVMSAMSSQTSVSSAGLTSGRRRGTSLSANAPEVITTDKVRPDWATKLSTARAHAARRSAAATALHTAAYMMNGQTDPRSFGAFSRRSMLRRQAGENTDGQASPLSALALLAERHAGRQEEQGQARPNPFLPPPRQSSSRRSRMDDLEDMMMMEAIRLSLASEEERRKKEDKDAKKEQKKKAKQEKKEEKAARKSTLFAPYSNDSASSMMERSRSNLSSLPDEDEHVGKGKGIQRDPSPRDDEGLPAGEGSRTSRFPDLSQSGTSQESLAPSIPIPTPAEPFKRSHLRQMSNASSATSSVADLATSLPVPARETPPLNEPMFNFQSLAAMIGEEEKNSSPLHVEHAPSNGTSSGVQATTEQNASFVPEMPVEGKQTKAAATLQDVPANGKTVFSQPDVVNGGNEVSRP